MHGLCIRKQAKATNSVNYTQPFIRKEMRPLDSLRIEGKKTIKLAKAITPSVKKNITILLSSKELHSI